MHGNGKSEIVTLASKNAQALMSDRQTDRQADVLSKMCMQSQNV